MSDVFQSIFERCCSAILVKDRDGKYLSVNPYFEERFALRSSEVLGRTDYDFFSAEVAQRFQLQDEQVLKSGRPFRMELPIEWQGIRTLFLVTKFVIDNPQGADAALCILATECDERRILTHTYTESRRRASEEAFTSLTASLSEREREVTRLLVENRSTGEIATELNLSPHTIRNHRKAIYRKLEVHSRYELISLARASGVELL